MTGIVALIDYGSGNLRSAEKALARAADELGTGHSIAVTADPATITGRRAAAAMAEVRFADVARAMGMRDRLMARTQQWERDFLAAQSGLARTMARLGGASRTFRMVLQSLILTIGALLVIGGHASGGVILASSVLSGRALAEPAAGRRAGLQPWAGWWAA